MKPPGDTRNGVCERAVLVEDEACAEVDDALGATHAATVAGYDGGSTTEQALYNRYVRAVARIAVAVIAPTMGPFRASSKGGFVREIGPVDAREMLVSVADARTLAANLRESALSDIERVRKTLAVAAGAEAPPAPLVLTVV
ncbi:MAG: hypothetical protein AAF170_15795 [Bacteroidota bacterium]